MAAVETRSSHRDEFLEQITVLILTYNEAPNIRRCLENLRRFEKIVVLDSCSNDGTQEIALSFPNTKLYERPFDNHRAQWTFGANECGIESPWVLALDADYMLGPTLVDEIAGLRPSRDISAYVARFRYLVYGKILTGTLYTPKVVLYRRSKGRFLQEGHTQRLSVEGKFGSLFNKIDHDDWKSLDRWIRSQLAYARLESQHIINTPFKELSFTNRLRSTRCLAPIVVFVYTMLIKLCVLDGWPGWFYALQRTVAEILIAMDLIFRTNLQFDETRGPRSLE